MVDADRCPHSILVSAADLEHHLQCALAIRLDESLILLAAWGDGVAVDAANAQDVV